MGLDSAFTLLKHREDNIHYYIYAHIYIRTVEEEVLRSFASANVEIALVKTFLQGFSSKRPANLLK